MSGSTLRLLTDEQHEYFVQHHIGVPGAEMAELMNREFGLQLTPRQISVYRKNHHLHSGLTGRFPKGNIPWSKGRKMPGKGRSLETQFKPGRMPHNYMPVGSEQWTTDGYLKVKIADPNKWRGKHILVWESVHGPKPPGGRIIFADGDRTNFDPENLILVTGAELCRMNQHGWIHDDGDLTKTGAALARLICTVAARKRAKKPKPIIVYYDPKTLEVIDDE